MCCNVLQCVACVAVCCSVTLCCSVLPHVAAKTRKADSRHRGGVFLPYWVCCSVLQFVAGCGSVLQSVSGCSIECTVEIGYNCSDGSPTTSGTCSTTCGDGKQAGTEACDDSNTAAGDGQRGGILLAPRGMCCRVCCSVLQYCRGCNAL